MDHLCIDSLDVLCVLFSHYPYNTYTGIWWNSAFTSAMWQLSAIW